jgi:hypothetical protein
MNKLIAYDGDTKFVRVSKAAARKAYDAGQPVVLCPVKLAPFGGFRPSCMVQRDFEDEKQRASYGLSVNTFADVVRDFCWYNCQLNETGYYASYWVQPVKPAVSIYDVQVTDTFGGEANYSWVRRYTLTVPADIKPATFMRKVKDLIGWTGVRCDVSNFGDGSLNIRPRGVCQVCFTSYHDGD